MNSIYHIYCHAPLGHRQSHEHQWLLTSGKSFLKRAQHKFDRSRWSPFKADSERMYAFFYNDMASENFHVSPHASNLENGETQARSNWCKKRTSLYKCMAFSKKSYGSFCREIGQKIWEATYCTWQFYWINQQDGTE